MTPEILEQILHLARLAPSGDNCQPWIFSWNGQQLHVRHDSVRGKHAMNRNIVPSTIAFGSLYAYIEIAAPKWGFKPRLADGTIMELDELLLVIEFDAVPAMKDPLFNSLEVRHVDRRLFKKQLIPREIMRVVESYAENLAANVTLGPAPLDELYKYITQSEKLFWNYPRVVRDLLRWIRFTENEAKEKKDGMYWPSLGAPLPAVLCMWFMRRFEWIQSLLSPFFTLIAPQVLGSQLSSCGGLLLFTVKEATYAAAFDCGRLAARAWIYLNSQGIAVHPLTLSSTPIFNRLISPNKLTRIDLQKAHFDQGHRLLRAHFNLQATDIPIWQLRVGYAPSSLPLEMRSLRLRVKLS